MRIALLSLIIFGMLLLMTVLVDAHHSTGDFLIGAGFWWTFSCITQSMPTPKFMGNRVYGAAYYLLNFLGANFFSSREYYSVPPQAMRQKGETQ